MAEQEQAGSMRQNEFEVTMGTLFAGPPPSAPGAPAVGADTDELDRGAGSPPVVVAAHTPPPRGSAPSRTKGGGGGDNTGAFAYNP